MSRVRVLAATVAISAAAISGVAVAADGPASAHGDASGNLAITPTFREHLTEGLAWLAEGAERPDAPEKSSSSEIRDSHEANDGNVSASKAHALAAAAAPALAGKDPIVPPADQIVRALGPNALQMEGRDGKPGGVVISDIPLAVPDPGARDGDWRPADLTFKSQGSRLVAARSLVPTSVPDAADGTFRVGTLGVQLAPEGSGSTATSYGTSVVHPNIADSTDLVTRSVGAGLKFGFVLRSPDASQTQRAKLDLPAGAKATLIDGAVRITDEKGNQIGTVSPAAATDADGISVPLETSLEGDTVSYRLKTDLAKLKGPVVIDPEMLYEWSTGDTDIDGWVYNENAAPFSGTILANDGMRIKGEPGTGYANQTWGGYTHWAPGDDTYGQVSSVSGQMASPEHGFFWKAEFGGLNYTLTAPYSAQDPNVNVGVLSSTDVNHPPTQRYQKQNASGGWNAPVASNLRQIPAGTLGATYRVYVGTDSTTPPTGGSNAKPDAVFSAVLYDFGLYGASNVARPRSELRIGWTKLWAADNYDPAIGNITSPTGWVKEDYALPVLATDRGTGIEKVEFYDQATPVPHMYGPGVAKTCVATGKILCPFTFNDTVPVAPLPEGIGTYDVRATDGGGRKAVKPATLKVDKTAPELTLEGTLFDDRSTPLRLGDQRELVVRTADGTPAGPAGQQRSGVAAIRVLVDGALVHAATQPTSGDSQGLNTAWQTVASGLGAGDHTVRVEAEDRVGHVRDASFLVTVAIDAPGLGAGPVPAMVDADGALVDLGLDLEESAIGVGAANGNLLVHEIDGPPTSEGNAFNAQDPTVDRWYNSFSGRTGTLGRGWSITAGSDVHLEGTATDSVVLAAPSDVVVQFARASDGTYTANDPDFWTLTRIGSLFEVTDLATDRVYTFSDSGRLDRVRNGEGVEQTYEYDALNPGRVARLTGAPNRTTTLAYTNGRIATSAAPGGGAGTYSYTANRLTGVSGPGTRAVTYTHDAQTRITSRTSAGATTDVTYDGPGRVRTLKVGTTTATFTYTTPQATKCEETESATRQTDVEVARDGATATYSYCFDAAGRLVGEYGSQPGTDDLAPNVDLRTANGAPTTYFPGAPIDVILGGDDEESGVASLEIRAPGGAVLASATAVCQPSCPTSFERPATVPTSSLPEGPSTLVVAGKDAQGNDAETADFPIIIDRTPPPPPTNVEGSFRDSAGAVEVTWEVPDDPDVATDVTGSGIGGSQYRVGRGGTWGPWTDAFESVAAVPTTTAGETIQVELKARDAVGNVSAVAASTVTATDAPPPPPAALPVGDEGQATARDDDPPTPGFGNCPAIRMVDTRTRSEPADVYAYKEEQRVHGSRIGIRCIGIPSTDTWTVRFNSSFEVKKSDGEWHQLVPRRDSETVKLKNEEVKVSGFNYNCKAEDHNYVSGRRTYRLHGMMQIDRRPASDDIWMSFEAGDRDLACPTDDEFNRRALVAWNYTAHRLPESFGDTTERTANKQLRKVLGDGPYLDGVLPRAWAAHHLVPWQDRRARPQRLLLFRCRIHPNRQINGQYLRGFGLRRRYGPKRNPAYETLRRKYPRLAERTYHGDTTRSVYFDELDQRFGGQIPYTCDDDRRNLTESRLTDLDRAVRLGKHYGRPQN